MTAGAGRPHGRRWTATLGRTVATRPGRAAAAALGGVVVAGCGWLALDLWTRTADLPSLTPPVSTIVLDREGRLLRTYPVEDGRWRLPVRLEDIDPRYVKLLVSHEDRRFHSHSGVDPMAMVRAAGQAVRHGRAVSGASTLTMQVARLLTGARTRSLAGKLNQIRLALTLERRLSKRAILELYLTLAPFGGNLEGVRTASLAWFGKEPRRLTPAQAALLVALPQAPGARRPDRHPAAARAARDRVLARAVRSGVLAQDEASAARTEAVPGTRRAFPQLAPHLADRLAAAVPAGTTLELTIDRSLQERIEHLLRERTSLLPSPITLALVIADHRTGEVLAHVGAPRYGAGDRNGYVDMSRAVRSPGSALKPLIYGLAFEAGIAHPESLIEDRPVAFGTYVPTNFGDDHHGTVSVRTALERSLNVPAVVLLDAVGPARLMARLRNARVTAFLPPGKPAGLAVALGGVGVTLEDLVQVYVAIARGGRFIPLRASRADRTIGPARLLAPVAAWAVADILAGVPAPHPAANGRLAFKTGTSYGYRDAWAVGFDGRHVIGVWKGRADAAPVPGMTGIKDAAPVLFEAFSRLKPEPEPLAPPPDDALIATNAELPPPLRRVSGRHRRIREEGPKIAFPPDGARVEARGATLPIRIRDGVPPFTWLVDGRPLATNRFERILSWRPSTRGHVALSVVDAVGGAARSHIFVD